MQKKSLRKCKKNNSVIYQIKPVIGKESKKKLIEYIKKDNWITEYKITKKFEEEFAKFTNSKECISFPNGTTTLTAILDCLNLKQNDEILVSNYTMIATANAARFLGLKVKLVDISKDDLCMCPKDLNKKISKKSKAVIYTQMNGRLGQIKEIKRICSANKIFLIEDAAHAIGTYLGNQHAGNIGIAGSFSFSMPKLITMGQGGAIVTNDKNLSKKLRLYKNFGRKKSGNDIHNYLGYNFKITDMQSIIALEQLKTVNSRIKKKKQIFKKYKDKLKLNKSIHMIDFKSNETPWSVDIYSNKISKIKKILNKNNIQTRDVYPPINSQKIYRYSKGLPVSNLYCKQGLWLPSSLDLKNSEINKICKLINQI